MAREHTPEHDTDAAREPTMAALAAAIREVEAPAAVRQDAVAFLQRHGVTGRDADALLYKGAERFLIYRTLVHNRLRAATREFIPRAVARRGVEAFGHDFAQFMAAHASHSPYLRDVPGEFVAWVLPRWQRDASVPAYLGDLARHELLEGEVRNDPHGGESPTGRPFALEATLVFDGTARLMHYRWAVHKLPYATDDTTVPDEVETALLVFRDAHAKVRYLELTRWAAAIVEQLLEHERCVRDALQQAAAGMGEPLDDDKLAKAATLFGELSDYGVLLGAG
ncbi:MAG: putative DNA-binding domain-containing protein [Nannocystaceae bacterium]